MHAPTMVKRIVYVAVAVVAWHVGPAAAETPPDGDARPAAESGAAEVWGDPEEAEVQAPDWTWFGMGYERRMQRSAATPSTGSSTHDPAGTRDRKHND